VLMTDSKPEKGIQICVASKSTLSENKAQLRISGRTMEEHDCFLGCCAVQSRRNRPMFQMFTSSITKAMLKYEELRNL
jgi:hypothetical protein